MTLYAVPADTNFTYRVKTPFCELFFSRHVKIEVKPIPNSDFWSASLSFPPNHNSCTIIGRDSQKVMQRLLYVFFVRMQRYHANKDNFGSSLLGEWKPHYCAKRSTFNLNQFDDTYKLGCHHRGDMHDLHTAKNYVFSDLLRPQLLHVATYYLFKIDETTQQVVDIIIPDHGAQRFIARSILRSFS
mgnify:CR=1 FL=1